MVRTILALSAVALIATTAGCRMCADPYDYSGPLYMGDAHGSPSAPDYRAGSRLQGTISGYGGVVSGYDSVSDVEMIPTALPEDSGETPAVPRKIQPIPDDYSQSQPRRLPGVEEPVRWAHTTEQDGSPRTAQSPRATRQR